MLTFGFRALSFLNSSVDTSNFSKNWFNLSKKSIWFDSDYNSFIVNKYNLMKKYQASTWGGHFFDVLSKVDWLRCLYWIFYYLLEQYIVIRRIIRDVHRSSTKPWKEWRIQLLIVSTLHLKLLRRLSVLCQIFCWIGVTMNGSKEHLV